MDECNGQWACCWCWCSEKLPEVAQAERRHTGGNERIVLSLELVCMKSPRGNCVLNWANGNREIIVLHFELV